jgi:hypothetical protein
MIRSPLNPPFLRGETNLAGIDPPFSKGGQGGIFAIALLSLLFTLIQFSFAQPPQPLASPTPDSSAFRGNLFKRMQENPLPYDQDISNLPLGQVNGSTVTLVQIRSKFSGSYNAAQDEMLYLVN